LIFQLVITLKGLLQQAAARGNRLSHVVSRLLELLDDYGAAELERAIAEALERQVPHPNAVRQALERRREQRHQPPPIAISLPDNARANHIVVRPASLARYDQLDSDEATPTDEASGTDDTQENPHDHNT
jgi:hypothetical protein